MGRELVAYTRSTHAESSRRRNSHLSGDIKSIEVDSITFSSIYSPSFFVPHARPSPSDRVSFVHAPSPVSCLIISTRFLLICPSCPTDILLACTRDSQQSTFHLSSLNPSKARGKNACRNALHDNQRRERSLEGSLDVDCCSPRDANAKSKVEKEKTRWTEKVSHGVSASVFVSCLLMR